MTSDRKHLIVLGCSAVKRDPGGPLPALCLYDGPMFRVVRAYLRDYHWPEALSLAVLSAKHGIIGGLSHISPYDHKMTPVRAAELAPQVTRLLCEWGKEHWSIYLILGQDYLRAVDHSHIRSRAVEIVNGPIGVKLNALHALLRKFGQRLRRQPLDLEFAGRLLYFLPDWDDFVDVDYDFYTDTFSAKDRSNRREKHSIALLRPRKLCDGVLISLAQRLGSKDFLKRIGLCDKEALAPTPVRRYFRLQYKQWAFGDCGAFSYVAADKPIITVEQALSLYELYEFDLGASVDHIPVAEIRTSSGKRRLSQAERRDRVRLTCDNAERFLSLHRQMGAKFLPVGVIQGITAQDYARQLGEYVEMGYRYAALGGLVPRSDAEIRTIVDAVAAVCRKLRQRPWIHLLGVFRPQLQDHFRQLGIGSFDSATYFRKAWLRSDQNYLGVDGNWYAAIRVPPLTDPRTRLRMEHSGVSERQLRQLESRALLALRAYDLGTLDIEATLAAVLEYDRLLSRAETQNISLADKYRRTLEAKPWRQCDCPVCRKLGIEVVIFRGMNRNKRRGAHNTLQLFNRVRRP